MIESNQKVTNESLYKNPKNIDRNISNSKGGTNKRHEISFSNFPLELDEDYLHLNLLTTHLTSFGLGDINLNYEIDTDQSHKQILVPAENLDYNLLSNELNLTFKFDPYKRNYFMLYDLAMSHLRKAKTFQGTEDREYIKTLDELVINKINIDLFDNYGNPSSLVSFSVLNCVMKSLSSLDFNVNDTNQRFECSFLFEGFSLNYDRMLTIEQIDKG